jgi:SOS-response transcriptional repressor LexA
VEWLTYGTGPINTESIPGSGESRWKRVPVISWEQAGDFEKLDLKTIEKWIWSDVETGPRTYALFIADDSMAPRYEPGTTVIIDYDHPPQHRNIAFFRWNKTQKVSCAQLLVDGPYRYLKPHNTDFETHLIDEGNPQITFCGTARQIFMTY